MANLLAHNAAGVEYRRIVADNILINNLPSNKTEIESPLTSMIAAIKEDERALYKRIGVGNYQGFLERLESIKINELNYLLSTGEVVKHYIKNYSFPNIADQDTAVDYLRQLIEMNYDKIIPAIEGKFDETVADITEDALAYIRQVFKEGNNSTKLRYFGKGRQKVGIAKITFKAQRKTDKNTVKPHITAEITEASAPISKTLISKIISKLGPVNSIIYAFPTIQSFKNDVEAIVLMTTPSNWKEAVSYAIKQGGIDISRSYAGLVGYLGELRALAILYKFFGTSIIATGGMRDIATKQQISIDAVVKQGLNYLGFQVKNYTLSSGKATFTSSMSSANFIQNRLCLTGTIGDILSDILATYQFNQPFTDEALVDQFKDSWLSVDEYKNNIYTKVEESVNQLHALFESRMGYLLRIGNNFSVAGTDGLFGKPQMYYNSFFIISEYYVPSSVILESILEELRGDNIQKYTTIDYNLTNNKEMVFENYYTNLPQRQDALEAQKIHYNITLDVAALVKRALAEI